MALPDPVLQGVDEEILRNLAHHGLVYGQADVQVLALGKILNP